MQEFTPSRKDATPSGLWGQRREASLNWLALGLLLAAWNSVDNDTSPSARRPETLRGYPCVSVRAVTKASTYCKAGNL
jgi:hypothetical protein